MRSINAFDITGGDPFLRYYIREEEQSLPARIEPDQIASDSDFTSEQPEAEAPSAQPPEKDKGQQDTDAVRGHIADLYKSLNVAYNGLELARTTNEDLIKLDYKQEVTVAALDVRKEINDLQAFILRLKNGYSALKDQTNAEAPMTEPQQPEPSPFDAAVGGTATPPVAQPPALQ